MRILPPPSSCQSPLPQAEYLLHRAEYTTELEDVFRSSPFEHFPLWRGQGDARHCVGQLKVGWCEGRSHCRQRVAGRTAPPLQGIVRVVDRADAEPLIDVEALLSPRSYVVRVYVLTGARRPLSPPILRSASTCFHCCMAS